MNTSRQLTFREMFQQYNQNEPEFVPLTNDLLFHKVFTGNKTALQALLCRLLNLKQEEIKEIDILNPIQYGDQDDSRQTVLDLRIHLNRNKYILVEMQVRKFSHWTNRSLVYTCRQVTDQIRGNEFNYGLLEQVVQISIMSYTLFPEHRRFFSRYSLKDAEGWELTEKMQLCVMDLSAMDLASEADRSQKLDEWAKLFNAKTWEDVEAITADEIQEVKKEMTFIMSQPTERDRIWARQMAIWDHNAMIADAKEEGREEGREEVREEAEKREQEMVRRMRAKGLSENDIKEITGQID